MRLALARSLALLLTLSPAALPAQTVSPAREVIDRVVEDHILPGYAAAADRTDALADAARADCDPDSEVLRAAWHRAFDAWLGVAHLQFGPAIEDNRGFAMGFWPDPRGTGPRTLARLVQSEAVAGTDPAAYAEVSVAARGFHALETMLYDARLREIGTEAYRCALIRTMAADLAETADDLLAAWREDYAATIRAAGGAGNTVFPAAADALRALYGAAETGLQFNAEVRLGRPLGTVERAFPTRAETSRSGRSLRNVTLSVAAAGELAVLLAAAASPGLAEEIAAHVARIDALADRVGDPALQGVDDPQERIRAEALASAIAEMGRTLSEDLAPALGVAGGFNALDGD